MSSKDGEVLVENNVNVNVNNCDLETTDVSTTAPQIFSEIQSADSKDAIVPNKIRVVYLTMVKNESRIIERSMKSASDFVDAFVVCDTGSTDATINLASKFIEKSGKYGGVVEHSWKNFGYNRSLSFLACRDFVKKVGWNLHETYCLLLDAHMIFRVAPDFCKHSLKKSGYSVLQKAGSLHYFNARLLRLSDNWSCVGATHEYWNGPSTENLDKKMIWIDDLNDGGCKSDKFIRDAKLLEKERDDDPTNCRTWFYLGQTYKDLGRTDEAIKAYEKRIEIGGWIEEVWYSHYMIAKLYFGKGDFVMGEFWALKGLAYHPSRAELYYLLARVFREKGEHFKSWYYMQKGSQYKLTNDVLFVETNVYQGLFQYEASILHYYCFPNERLRGLELNINYLNGTLDEYKDNVWSNLPFYVQKLPEKRQGTLVKGVELDRDVWRIGSCSAVWLDDEYDFNSRCIMNLRHSNYECSDFGDYSSRDGDGIVRTQNAFSVITNNGQNIIMNSHDFISESSDSLPTFETHIRGLEDIRLWKEPGTQNVYFTAAAMDRVPEKRYRIINGKYDWENNILDSLRVLIPPTETSCEKNWLQIGVDTFLYGWSPLQICNGSGHLIHRTEKQELPWIFSKFRGSAGPVYLKNKNQLLFLCHSVHYGRPRKYFHYLVVLENHTYKVVKWSLPFSFTGASIEYCLTMLPVSVNEENDVTGLKFIVSRFDKNPIWIEAKLSKDFFFQSK